MLATAMLLCTLAFADDARPEAPPAGPPPRAQRQRGDRPPLPELDALTQQQAWELTRVQATLPDPNTALNQSLIVGFGAGHFYAKQPQIGYIHASVQVAALGIAGVSAGLATQVSSSGTKGQRRTAMMFVGFGVFGVARLVDTYTAPISAHMTADEALTFSR
jgi:hypothetical protein